MSKNRKHDDDPYKTGCVGIVIPLFFAAAYGIPAIVRKKTWRQLGRPPVVGPEAIEIGIAVLGVALLVHAWGFEPYKRHPIIRGLLTVVGIAMFLKGIIRGV